MNKMNRPKSRSGPNVGLRMKATQAYQCARKESLEEKRILSHLPLVKHVVNKIVAHIGFNRDVEDLVSAGTVGLVRAARSFDSAKDAEFKTYAYIRIRGAVLDEIRSRSPMSSTVHGRVSKIQHAYQACRAETGSPPSDEQLAERCGLSVKEMYRALQDARKQNFLSIHGLTEEDPVLGRFLPAAGADQPGSDMERREIMQQLAQAIQELPKRDRLLILLYYERDLTMKEAAQVLGVTESRVSQIHASALFKLSMKMKEAS
ncbi:MAG: sigma-70 family RNA polymerase sigma factor [Phycisphaerae bacterium]